MATYRRMTMKTALQSRFPVERHFTTAQLQKLAAGYRSELELPEDAAGYHDHLRRELSYIEPELERRATRSIDLLR